MHDAGQNTSPAQNANLHLNPPPKSPPEPTIKSALFPDPPPIRTLGHLYASTPARPTRLPRPTMGHDEQVEEMEVLESIFPEELTKMSDSEFRVSVTLDLPDDSEEPADPPTILLQVRLPEDYPDKAPHLDLLSPPNAPSHAHFSLYEDRDALLATLTEVAEDNLGMAMVFTLVSSLKDEAESLVAGRVAGVEREREEEMLAAEREENRKFHGTVVTPERFMRWREAFMKEMEEKRVREEEERLAEMKKARVKEPVKMTGRQLWESGLAGKGEPEDDEEGVVEGVQKMKVEA